ncbi:MAG: MFS transporter [candidate division Zixibacteria bacterium]|nr:MFS transporter [candidate division Zixibacteria bacterium]
MKATPTADDSTPGSPLRGTDASIRRWLALASVEGAFANVFVILTGGAFLTGLALFSGANDVTIGLLAAIPFLAQVAQLLSAYLVDITGHRKSITIWASIVARQIWWILVPLLLLVGRVRTDILLGTVAVSSIALMIANPAWMAWMADLVPQRIRGRYFGFRSTAVAVTTLLATIFGGIILDHFHTIDEVPVGFAIIIAAAGTFALAAVILLNKIPDRPSEEIRVPFHWARLIAPFRDTGFRRLVSAFSFWNLAVGIAAAFYAVHMLTNLGMRFTQIAIYSSMTSIVAIGLNRPWGKLIDRFGSKPIIVLCALGLTIVPLIWWIPRPGSIGILWFEAVYSGALWTGFNLGVFNIPITASPREGRTMYLAAFSVVSGAAFFVASLAGGVLAENWSGLHWHLGRQIVVNYHLLFAVSALLRFVGAILFMRVHEPRETGLPVVVHHMSDAVLGQLSHGRRILAWIWHKETNAADAVDAER